MKELLDNLEHLERKLALAKATLDNTPQMLDDGPYLASYDILTYENQGTLNPEWQAAFDEWIEIKNAVINALVILLDAGGYSVLPSWFNPPKTHRQEIAERAVIQLTNSKTIAALVDQARLQYPQEIELLITVAKQKGASVLVDFTASYMSEFSLNLSVAIKSCYLDSQLSHLMYYGNIRCAIIAALTAIGSQATDALLSALGRFQTWPNHLGLVIYTLGVIGDRTSVESLTKLKSHPNPSISVAICDAIVSITASQQDSK